MFSLVKDTDYQKVADLVNAYSPSKLKSISLASDNSSGGPLNTYHMVIGALIGRKCDYAEIPDSLNDNSTLQEWLIAAQDFNTDGYSGAAEFKAAIKAVKDIIAPGGQYCSQEIEQLKNAWKKLEYNKEPNSVLFRTISGGKLGGAIKSVKMPELSTEDMQKIGTGGAFDIDTVGSNNTGNAWIIGLPSAPGALSLDNYQDLYQWVYSGNVLSNNEPVKIIWDFKNSSGTSKFVLEKEINMQPNTWYCLKLSDFYDSMTSFIESFGSAAIQSVTYDIFNKPFETDGMILGDIFAVESLSVLVPEDLNDNSNAAEWLYFAEQVDLGICKETDEFYSALTALREAIEKNRKLIESSLTDKLGNLWLLNEDVDNVKRIAGVSNVEVKDGYNTKNTSARNDVNDFTKLPLGTNKAILGKYYAKATFPSLRYFLFRNTENNGDRFNVSLEGYDCLYFYIYAENVTASGALDTTALNMSWKSLASPKIEINKSMSNKWVRVCITSDTLEEMFAGTSDEKLASVQIYNVDGNIQADAIYISDLFVGNKKSLLPPGTLNSKSTSEDWVKYAEELPDYNTTGEFKTALAALRTCFTDKGRSLFEVKKAWERLDRTTLPGGNAPDNAGALLRPADSLKLENYTDTDAVNSFKNALNKAKEYYSVNIQVDIEGNATVYGAGVSYENETVVLKAVVADGYEFGGWYENNEFIAYAESEYRFIATKDRNLKLLSMPSTTFTDSSSGITVTVNRNSINDNYQNIATFEVEPYNGDTLLNTFTERYGFNAVSMYTLVFKDLNGNRITDLGGRKLTLRYKLPSGTKAGHTNLVKISDRVTVCDCNYYEDELVYTFNYNPDESVALLILK